MNLLNDEMYEIYKTISHAGELDPQLKNIKTGTAGVLGKGDFIQFQIQIIDDHIVQSRYKVQGAAATIVCCELLARAILHVSLKEAASFNPNFLIEQLHLPRQRQPSAMLAVNALRGAIGVL